MTQQSRLYDTTEFSGWLRKQEQIDSKIGFITSDIDYVWNNYNTGKWCFIEEKRYMAKPEFPQRKIFKMLNKVAKCDPNYRGFHLIQFERTSPEDGNVYIDNKLVSKEQLIDWLVSIVR